MEAKVRTRIVAFAYSCVPGGGSEMGAGWVWSRMLAGIGDTWVITRPFPGRRRSLEGRLAQLPERERLRFVYVDVPAWMSFVGGRVQSDTFGRIEYVVWQLLALRRARSLHASIRFDLAWHLVYANAWIGSLAALVGPRFVYGPVGGGVNAPWRLVAGLGVRGVVYEVLRAAARWAGRHLNPIAALSWRRATLILVQNRETKEWLPPAQRQKAHVFPNAVLEESPVARPTISPHATTAMYAGRLIPLKGLALAIEAISLLPPEWTLRIYGEGSDEARLRALCRERGVADRVVFLGSRPREEVMRAMREDASVFLFPSLHDEGSWSVVEAAASGLPVVCLDVGGQRLVASETVRPGSPAETAHQFARAVLAAKAPPPIAGRMTLGPRLSDLVTLLAETGTLPRRARQP